LPHQEQINYFIPNQDTYGKWLFTTISLFSKTKKKEASAKDARSALFFKKLTRATQIKQSI
jgi:hypothetical protein